MRSIEARGCITIVMWLSYLGFVYIAMTMIDVWAALIAFVIMIPLVMGMGGVWNLFGHETSNATANSTDENDDMEKRKRANLDTVLRDLSDDDLVRLRQRLQDGTVDDDVLYNNLVGDDGEFTYERDT